MNKTVWTKRTVYFIKNLEERASSYRAWSKCPIEGPLPAPLYCRHSLKPSRILPVPGSAKACGPPFPTPHGPGDTGGWESQLPTPCDAWVHRSLRNTAPILDLAVSGWEEQTWAPVLDFILPSLSSSAVLWFPVARQTCSLLPVCFTSPSGMLGAQHPGREAEKQTNRLLHKIL